MPDFLTVTKRHEKPTKAKRFRFQAKTVGLTFSCPVNAEQNPLDALWSAKTFLEQVRKWKAIEKYIICQEAHESGKFHYHLYLKFAEKLETESSTFFNLSDVHPNIINKPGSGWITYCTKDGNYITNFYEPCPWVQARDAGTVAEAVATLWKKRPREMMLHGKNIIENLTNAKKPKVMARIFNGPFMDIQWTNYSHTLILEGEPGVGKTQWARWWGAHHGGYFYCKGSLECLRHYNNEAVVIYDDIDIEKYDKLKWDDIFDVENGGTIAGMRYKDITVPPGPKIWLQNPGMPRIPDPYKRIYGRRVTELFWDTILSSAMMSREGIH